MQCSDVVISGAFKSNHIADMSLQRFWPRELTNQNATFSFIMFYCNIDQQGMNWVQIYDNAKGDLTVIWELLTMILCGLKLLEC